MTRDEIIEMARQVSNTPIDATSTPDLFGVNQIVKFAKLVAQHEREVCIDMVAMFGGSIEIEAAIRARGQA